MNYSSIDFSTFDSLELSFQTLCAASTDLAIEGSDVAGFPDRPIGLTELRRVLLRLSTTYEQRDAALGIVLCRAQTHGNEWAIGLAGMLLPGLRTNAWRLVRQCPWIRGEIESEIVIGLLHALKEFSPGESRLASHLIWRSRRGASRLVNDELKRMRHGTVLPESATMHRSPGHFDFVLERAIVEHVVGLDDAELIATTRLEGVKLAEAAAARGLKYSAAASRRRRAECLLRDWLANEGFTTSGSEENEHRGRSHRVTVHAS